MRIVYVADARSPIARAWIDPFVRAGHEVHVVSTFHAPAVPGAASLEVVPVGFSGLGRGGRTGGGERGAGRSTLPWLSGAGSMGLRASVRHWLGPVTIGPAAVRLRRILARWKPELVHALRLPMEGMLAAAAEPECPLVISLWGNDLTLHAPAAPGMRRLTRKSLRRADGLIADCRRDVRLAGQWGFPSGRPHILLPTNGGIDLDLFRPANGGVEDPPPHPALRDLGRRSRGETAVNPRGFRGYVRSDTFFRAVARLQPDRPGLCFLCPAMAGEREAERWRERLGIEHSVLLLPRLDPPEMATVFRLSGLTVSVSEHDGTPNSLLEAMACGSFPICGDLESIRDWIEDGVNGLLVDAGDPQALAGAIARALDDQGLRERAAERNRARVREKAERGKVFKEAEAFCSALVKP